jgi:hypothetical protein
MSSTNKTTNYELSQFLGSDKPAWLSDYNTDMGKIDAQMKLNADAATAATGSATSANTAIGTLENLTTDAKTNLVAAVNEVDSHADSAVTTANTAALNASTALTGLSKFDLDTEIPLTVTSNLGTVLTNTLKIRKDSTNSVYKIYGQVTVGSLANVSGTLTLTISPTSGLNPSEAYNVECGCLVLANYVSYAVSMGSRKFTVGTDGTISIPSENLDGGIATWNWFFTPCVYFNKSFGD